jgi:hypothetical protein
MAGKTPTTDFIELLDSQIDLDIEFYVQSDGSGSLPAGEYKGRLSQIVTLFVAQGFVRISGAVPYSSDEDAAIGGVAIGEFYEVGIAHEEGAIEGSLKKRIV